MQRTATKPGKAGKANPERAKPEQVRVTPVAREMTVNYLAYRATTVPSGKVYRRRPKHQGRPND